MNKPNKKHIKKVLSHRKKTKDNNQSKDILILSKEVEISEIIKPINDNYQSREISKDVESVKITETLVAVAIALWRINIKLDTDCRSKLPQQLRHLPRHLQVALDALSAIKLEIDDPINKPYSPGMALNVIAFQPIEGISSKYILETIKPSIYYNSKLIQQADVIVASEINSNMD